MRVLDLFCGAGGFSKGFEQAGFDIVLGIDNDPRVKETYEANHDAEFMLADINELNPQDIHDSYGPFKVVIGSPPCGNFSLIATVSRDIEQGLVLVNEFKRFIDALHPTFWVMENVAPAQRPIRNIFPRARSKVLDSVDFGVPQFRKRVFFGNYPEPMPTHDESGPQSTLDGRLLHPWTSLGDILDPHVNYGFLSAKRDYDLEYRKSRRRVRKGKGAEIGNVIYPDILDRPGRTLLAKPSQASREIHVVQVGEHRRFLTIPEIARLNGFRSDFLWFGTRTSIISMIGNAVSPPVSLAIANAILKTLQDPTPVTITEQAGNRTPTEECTE